MGTRLIAQHFKERKQMVQMEFEQNDLKPGLGAWLLLSREDFHVLKLWAEKEGPWEPKNRLKSTWLLMLSLPIIGAGETFDKLDFFISQSRQRPWLAWLKSNCYWFCFASSLPKCTFNDQLYLFALDFIATASHYKPFACFWGKNEMGKWRES